MQEPAESAMLLAVHVLAPGDSSEAGRDPVFKRWTDIVQMMFHKENSRGVGGAERSCGLSGLGVEEGAGLGSHILKGEDGGILGPSLSVRERMSKDVQVDAVNRRATEICLQETEMGRGGGRREQGR